jgi:Kelch motif
VLGVTFSRALAIDERPCSTSSHEPPRSRLPLSWFPLAWSGARGQAVHTATLLSGGRVLVAGGLGAMVNGDNPIIDSAEVFDPRTGAFSATGTMTSPRVGDHPTLLSDGRVMFTGGSSKSGTLRSTEIYDPRTGTFGSAG